MKAKDPVTKEWRYFVDKCLPFDPALVQRFSDTLSFLIHFRLKVK